MNIAQILKAKGRAVATARPENSVQEVSEKLAQKKIGAIVIVGESGRVAGIISERDIIRAIAEHGSSALTKPVSEFMTKGVVSCSETTTLDEMMETMTTHRFRHMPVMEDGSLVGIVSIGDIVKHHLAEIELEVSAMRGYFATG